MGYSIGKLVTKFFLKEMMPLKKIISTQTILQRIRISNNAMMIPAQLGGESLPFNLFILTPKCVWKYSIIILPTEFIKMLLYRSLRLLVYHLQGHSHIFSTHAISHQQGPQCEKGKVTSYLLTLSQSLSSPSRKATPYQLLLQQRTEKQML